MKFKPFSALVSFLKTIPVFKNFAKPLARSLDTSTLESKSADVVAISYTELAPQTCEPTLNLTPSFDYDEPVGKLQAEARGEAYVETAIETETVVTLPKVAKVVALSPEPILKVEVTPVVLEPEMPVPIRIIATSEPENTPEPVLEIAPEPAKKPTRKRATIKKTVTKKKTPTKKAASTEPKRTLKSKKGEVPLEARGFGF